MEPQATAHMTSALEKTPEQEIIQRLQALKQEMEKSDLQAVFITHKPDIFYFSGTSQDCYLYVHREHEPLVFVKRYYPRARQESCLDHIFPISSLSEIPERIKDLHPGLPQTCGIAFDVVPVRDFHFFQHLFASVSFMDCTPAILGCRQLKSPYEIIQMEQAARLSHETFLFIQEHLVPGISEMEFCGIYETFARKRGHSGLLLTRHYRAIGFPFHLLSGKSGGMAGAVDTPCCGEGTSIAHPYGAGAKPLQRDEPILIDFGTVLNGYHMDETRMFVMGAMEPKARDASQAAIEILHTLLAQMKPGVAMGDIFELSVQTAQRLGYAEQFLGLAGIKSKFIGHSLGLELVESPFISEGNQEPLQAGMVLAMEPKFIFKDEFAAGIESVIHMTRDGARFLSTTPPQIFQCR